MEFTTNKTMIFNIRRSLKTNFDAITSLLTAVTCLLCVAIVTSQSETPHTTPPWRPIPEWSTVQKTHYPNPRTHPEQCSPQLKLTEPIWWCDPNSMLDKTKASQLDLELKMTNNGDVYIYVAIMKKSNARSHFTQNEKKDVLSEFAYFFLPLWIPAEQDGVIILVSVLDNMMYVATRVKENAMMSTNSCTNAIENGTNSLSWDSDHLPASLQSTIIVYKRILNGTHECGKSETASGSSGSALPNYILTIIVIVVIVCVLVVILIVVLYYKHRVSKRSKDSANAPLKSAPKNV